MRSIALILILFAAALLALFPVGRGMTEHDSDYTIHIEEGMMGMGGHRVRMAAHFFHGFAGGMGHYMMGSDGEVTEDEWPFRTAP